MRPLNSGLVASRHLILQEGVPAQHLGADPPTVSRETFTPDLLFTGMWCVERVPRSRRRDRSRPQCGRDRSLSRTSVEWGCISTHRGREEPTCRADRRRRRRGVGPDSCVTSGWPARRGASAPCAPHVVRLPAPSGARCIAVGAQSPQRAARLVGRRCARVARWGAFWCARWDSPPVTAPTRQEAVAGYAASMAGGRGSRIR